MSLCNEFLKKISDIDVGVGTLINKFYKIRYQHVPIIKNFKHKYPVLYNSEIIKLIKGKVKFQR